MKKFLCKCMALVMAFSLLGPLGWPVEEVFANDPLVNLALGLPDGAFSAYPQDVDAGNHLAAWRAFDGRGRNEAVARDGVAGPSRWATGNVSSAFIQVNLGGLREIDHIVLEWELPNVRGYEIQVADYPGGAFRPVYTVTDRSNAYTDNISIGDTAWIVRMQGTEPGGWGFSLWEFEVWGPDAGPALFPCNCENFCGCRPCECDDCDCDFVNLAPGLLPFAAAAFSSSPIGGNHYVRNAFDGNRGTRWSSEAANPWIQIDLGGMRAINRIVLAWQAAFASSYVIEVADYPGGVFRGVANFTRTGAGGDTDYTFDVPVTARLMRMRALAVNNPAWGASLYEFEIWGPDPGDFDFPCTCGNFCRCTDCACAVCDCLTNLALLGGAVYSASSFSGYPSVTSTYHYSRAFDGLNSTRWGAHVVLVDGERPDPSPAQWLQVDLGALHYIEHAVVLWEAAFAAEYRIEVSLDGDTWATAYTQTGGTGGEDILALAPGGVLARFVRMYAPNGTGDNSYGISLWEFEVWGNIPAPCCDDNDCEDYCTYHCDGDCTCTEIDCNCDIPVPCTHDPCNCTGNCDGTTCRCYFVAATSITGVPTTGQALTPVLLTGAVNPANATDTTITWSLGTGSTAEGAAVLQSPAQAVATGEGTVVVEATVANALLAGAYTWTFIIDFEAPPAVIIPVTSITGVATTGTAMIPVLLEGTVLPSDSTFYTIVWTGAAVSFDGGRFYATSTPGSVTVTATIANGVDFGVDFVRTFNIVFACACEGDAADCYCGDFCECAVCIAFCACDGDCDALCECGDTCTCVYADCVCDVPEPCPVTCDCGSGCNGVWADCWCAFDVETPDCDCGDCAEDCEDAVNLARLAGAVPSASSVSSGYPLANAFDGDRGTRWGADTVRHSTDPQWIQVDLGGVRALDRAVLVWEGSFAANYDIQLSMDGIVWRTAYPQVGGTGGEDIIGLDGRVARFVRMFAPVGTGPEGWGISLYEFEVWGQAPCDCDPGPGDCAGDCGCDGDGCAYADCDCQIPGPGDCNNNCDCDGDNDCMYGNCACDPAPTYVCADCGPTGRAYCDFWCEDDCECQPGECACNTPYFTFDTPDTVDPDDDFYVLPGDETADIGDVEVTVSVQLEFGMTGFRGVTVLVSATGPPGAVTVNVDVSLRMYYNSYILVPLNIGLVTVNIKDDGEGSTPVFVPAAGIAAALDEAIADDDNDEVLPEHREELLTIGGAEVSVAPPAVILGDVNGDGVVTLEDVVWLAQFLAGHDDVFIPDMALALVTCTAIAQDFPDLRDVIRLRRYLASPGEIILGCMCL